MSLAARNTIEALKLVIFSSVIAVLFVGWEDLSMAHPLRSNLLPLTASAPASNTRTLPSFGQSTVRGLGFGMPERQKSIELEKEITQEESSLSVRSYNEVLLEHRAERIPSWISEQDISLTMVKEATRTIQLSLLQLQQCQNLAANYEWDKLSQELQDPLLHSRLEKACSVLKRAPDNLLSIDARDDIGFDWGSCAWRHCGALADAQEALDELDHLVGVLEPFEALFCLDIVERSFRDMLAVTEQYQDPSIKLSVYKPLERMVRKITASSIDFVLRSLKKQSKVHLSDSSFPHLQSDLTEDEANKTLDDDYLAALETVRAMEEQEAAASGK